MNDHTGTRITEVRTVSIPVGDVERARDFYTTVLGFDVRLDVPYGDGKHWIELAPPGATTSIALSPPGPGHAPGVDTGIRFVTADVEADHRDLKARGVDVDPEIMRWPGSPPMFQLRDTDGNLLRVVQDVADPTGVEPGGPSGQRFAVLVKSSAADEAGALPDADSLTAMVAFNDGLIGDGLLLAGEGLHPSSAGARIRFRGDEVTVVRGPFPEPEKLVAGFWLIRAASLDEAIDRMRRAPMGDHAEIEIRRVLDPDDFGEALTPELRAHEEQQRARAEADARKPRSPRS